MRIVASFENKFSSDTPTRSAAGTTPLWFKSFLRQNNKPTPKGRHIVLVHEKGLAHILRAQNLYTLNKFKICKVLLRNAEWHFSPSHLFRVKIQALFIPNKKQACGLLFVWCARKDLRIVACFENKFSSDAPTRSATGTTPLRFKSFCDKTTSRPLKVGILFWCARKDLNLHTLRHMLLRHACLPFHHSRVNC